MLRIELIVCMCIVKCSSTAFCLTECTFHRLFTFPSSLCFFYAYFISARFFSSLFLRSPFFLFSSLLLFSFFSLAIFHRFKSQNCFATILITMRFQCKTITIGEDEQLAIERFSWCFFFSLSSSFDLFFNFRKQPTQLFCVCVSYVSCTLHTIATPRYRVNS